MKKAILLVNVGTPDSLDIRDIRKYLSLFLNDPHVMNIPWLWRKILVNGIIVPFRASGSAAKYRQLWTENGSPLRLHLENIRDKLQERLGDQADIWIAMNYSEPYLPHVMQRMQEQGYREIVVIPLFPQYAVSTTGSVEDNIMKYITQWPVQPKLTIVRQFYDHPVFLDAWTDRIAAYCPEQYEHVVFSFHGLPLSHLPLPCRKEQIPCGCSQLPEAMDVYAKPNRCYRWACYDMACKLAGRLGLKDDQYTVAFQSRISSHWMRPFTDHVLKKLASKSAKVLVVAPSFVADCLETSVELDIEYKELFLERGGSAYTLVDSLNDEPKWIETLVMLSEKNIKTN